MEKTLTVSVSVPEKSVMPLYVTSSNAAFVAEGVAENAMKCDPRVASSVR
jgi:hypothetical protein